MRQVEARRAAGRLYDDAFAASFIRNLGSGGSEGRAGRAPATTGSLTEGIFDIINLAGLGSIEADRRQARHLYGFNLNVIALEIPTNKVTGTGASRA
jgi:hypothetical protein